MELKTLTASLLAAAISVAPVQGTEIPNTDTIPENPTQEESTAQLFTATLSSIQVTFNYNYDSKAETEDITDGNVTEPTAPTRSGYAFDGWYSDEDLTTSFDFNTTITESTTLYAKWTKTFTVSFSSNGGSAVTVQTIKDGEKASKPTDPTREDYTFDGWYSDEELKNSFDFSSTTITESTTLYAKWIAVETKVDTFTVTFDSNGGSSVNPETVKEGEKATNPTAPTRSDYTFDGWYSDEDFETSFDFDTTITKNTTLYAKWSPVNSNDNNGNGDNSGDHNGTVDTYTVTFESNEGSTVQEQKVGEGGTVTQPDTPTRTGYTFSGWYSDADFKTPWNFSNSTVTTDTTLYAQWSKIVEESVSYTVTFSTGLGSTVPNQSILEGGNVVEPNEPTRTGYDFTGWYQESATTTKWNFDLGTVTKAMTLYAGWTAIEVPEVTYSVSFNSNGGSPITTQTITDGGKATEPPEPTRTDYDFEGWYTDGALTNPFDFSTKIEADTTLYAKWKTSIEEYTVTFDSNGGSSVSTQTIEDDNLVTKPTDPTLSSYSFAGWYTDSDLTTSWNFSSDKITEDTTLYAKWTPIILHTTEGYLYNAYGDSIAGATIKLLKPGTTTTLYSETTNAAGFYEFFNVPEGFYNLVVTTDDVNRIYAVYIEEKDTELDNINLPISQVSAYVSMSSTTSVLMVDGLNNVADSIASDESSTSKVNVTLTVSTGDSDEIDEIDEEIDNGYVVASYFDLTLKKSITTTGFTTSETITDTGDVLGFYLNIPTAYRGKDEYVIYRYHDDAVDVITTKKNSNGEQIVVDDGGTTIYLTACHFSTFAIAYFDEDVYDEDVEDEDEDDEDDADDDANNLVRATILFNGYNMNNENIGTVTFSDANPEEGDTVTITLNPATGFMLSYVYARTEEGKAVNVLKNEDGTYHFIKPEGDVVVTASFALNGTSGNTGSTGGSSGNLANFSYFSDVFITDSYCQAVNEMVRLGLMQGTGDGKFSPHSEITRGMIVQILHNLSGESSNVDANFSDVSQSDYFYASVNWAKSNGVVAGYDDGTFQPHKPITREELAVILYGYGQRYGYVTNFDNYIYQDSLTFGDATAISHWASRAVTWAYYEGMMEERSLNFFSPKAYATRAEVAVTMWNFVD